MSLFKKAVKHEAKLRLAIAGPSGSGKTFTALKVGAALANGGKVALVDTEHGSASKYADLWEFDVAEMTPPYTPDKYMRAIEEAAEAGYDVLILDSMSHAWNGAGGMLEMVDKIARTKYKGNSYAAWNEVTPMYQRLVDAIIGSDLHIIATMRSKQDYILVERNGRQAPQKVGMAPIQRDGFEYEFDVFLNMDIENTAVVSKTRCPALTGAIIEKPGDDLATTLREWLQGVERPEQAPDPEPPRQPRQFKDRTASDGTHVEEEQTAPTGADYGTGDNGDTNGGKFWATAYDRIPYFNAPKHAEHTAGLLGLSYPQTKDEAAAALIVLEQYASLRADGVEQDDAVFQTMGGSAEEEE